MSSSFIIDHASPGICALVLALALAGCTTGSPHGSAARSAWQHWQKERHESVAGTNGWTTVVGLHWLAEGRNPIGPEPDDAVPFPGQKSLGELQRQGRDVWFHPAPESTVSANGAIIRQPLRLIPDVPGPANRLHWGDHQFWLLQRGERLGIRVRDSAAATRRDFRGLSYFPWNVDWQITARFEPHPATQTLPITDVTGATKAELNPGVLVFHHDGQEQRLEALADLEAGDLFVLFQDATNGSSTYRPGRFLHVAYPDGTGNVLLDFNRAYNPPCAFTDFATCPRPPAGNRLPFAVTAGEKKYDRQN